MAVSPFPLLGLAIKVLLETKAYRHAKLLSTQLVGSFSPPAGPV